MKFNQNEAKAGAIDAAAAVGGAVLGNTITKIIAEKAPEKVGKYAGAIVLGLGILVPAFVPVKSEALRSAILGSAVIGALDVAGQFTTDETGAVATTGIKGMVAKYVPQLSGTSLGNAPFEYVEYSAPAQNFLEAGNRFDAVQQANPVTAFLTV